MKKILLICGEPEKLLDSLKSLQAQHDVDLAISVSAVYNCFKLHEEEGGLDYYDLIIMDPELNPDPMYNYVKSDSGQQTGWFLYQDFMKDLKTPIIIWTFFEEEYTYSASRYPKRRWGVNMAGIIKKSYSSDSLLLIAAKYSREEGN